MLEIDTNKKILVGCLASSFLVYHTARRLYSFLNSKSNEWVPIGVVKNLHIYPIKSCKPVDVFAFKCTKLGPIMGDLEDRAFMLVDGDTGRFVTARQKPKLVNLECFMENETLKVTVPGKPSVHVDMKQVMANGKTIRAIMFREQKIDGLDCGDEIAQLLSEFIEEPNHRLLYHKPGMYTERSCVPKKEWWNNNSLPEGKYDSQFTDMAPFHICTTASMAAFNEKMNEKEMISKISMRNFRPSIEVSGCPAWDEDKWAELRIGDAHLEVVASCARCVLTTVDPEEGTMNKDNQPLKKLREFRIAPDGPMRKTYLDSPIFGVYAGLVGAGYVHVGQTVWAKYKPCAF
uniref:MOSC domain-containing protein n=1 Tax=Caenorhabditis tropicalis TaxID=1561998 RepID=A0A1I7TRB8_9PELO